MKKERAVVICPGRGTYTKETLGYLKKFRPKLNEFFGALDDMRATRGEVTISQLDDEPVFKPGLHTKGENASTLIYACSYADYLSLDFDKYDIVAVTGNSMGWYIALAVAGALDVHGAFETINTMGSMMKEKLIGGQIIYPTVDENWHRNESLVRQIQEALIEVKAIPECEAYLSINLGGYSVIGGNQKALDFLLKKLPKMENYPFQLINHGAFHTPLLDGASNRAFEMISPDIFKRPGVPLIDGRGHIWSPYSTDLEDIYRYTFDHQVVKPYDFTKAVTVSLKEFCPDRLILLGPGNSLGGSIGQILIENKWLDIKSKGDFSEHQKRDPFLVSLGRV
ncbi:MAG: ACP S-malonyltransferase [Pseudobdellovibrionaceae bacterium]